jgi:hypothetical protein
MDSRYFPSRYYEDNKDINRGFVSKQCLFSNELIGSRGGDGSFRQLKQSNLWIWGNLTCGIGGNNIEIESVLNPRAVRACGHMWADVHLGESFFEGLGYQTRIVAFAATTTGFGYVWGATHPNLLGNGTVTSTNQLTPFLSVTQTATIGVLGKGHSARHLTYLPSFASTPRGVYFTGENGSYERGQGTACGTTDICSWIRNSCHSQSDYFYKLQFNDRNGNTNCVPRGIVALKSVASQQNHMLAVWSCCSGNTSALISTFTSPGTGTTCNLILDFESARTGFLYTIGTLCNTSSSGSNYPLRFYGYNCCGLHGNGTAPNSSLFCGGSVPSLPAANTSLNPTPIKKMAVGARSAFVILFDGSLWAWGDNTNGQLGIGQALNVISCPVQVGTEYNWRCIATSAEGDVVGAIKTDGSLWVWGRSSYIEGNGSVTTDRCVPTRAACGMSNNWVRISVTSQVIAGITEETLA